MVIKSLFKQGITFYFIFFHKYFFKHLCSRHWVYSRVFTFSLPMNICQGNFEHPGNVNYIWIFSFYIFCPWYTHLVVFSWQQMLILLLNCKKKMDSKTNLTFLFWLHLIFWYKCGNRVSEQQQNFILIVLHESLYSHLYKTFSLENCEIDIRI